MCIAPICWVSPDAFLNRLGHPKTVHGIFRGLNVDIVVGRSRLCLN